MWPNRQRRIVTHLAEMDADVVCLQEVERSAWDGLVALVEPLKLGVFVSALVSDVASNSVWTLDALALLVPAVTRALWRLAPPAAAPKEASLLVGTYGGKGGVGRCRAARLRRVGRLARRSAGARGRGAAAARPTRGGGQPNARDRARAR